MDVKVSVDGSAKPLTSNPLPRNFNYKVITKIQELNGMNSDNRPLDKLEENAVVLVIQNDGLINVGTFLFFKPFPDLKIKLITYLPRI